MVSFKDNATEKTSSATEGGSTGVGEAASASALTMLDGKDLSSETATLGGGLGGSAALLGSDIPASEVYTRKRKYALLLVFCLAQFLDAVGGYSTLVALPFIERDMRLDQPTGTWILNSATIAFAGTLLFAGRLSDIYNPKAVFMTGLLLMAIFGIVAGASTSSIMMILARAICGVGGALTIPSALKSIVQVFTDKREQRGALTAFAAVGAAGVILGLIISGFIVAVNWRWSFYWSAIGIFPLVIACIWVVPASPKQEGSPTQLDIVGLLTMTAALVLFSFGLTNGATSMKWVTPAVIAPLVLSMCVCTPAFFLVERWVAPQHALIPPRTWKLPNFLLLLVVTTSNYSWTFSSALPHLVLWTKPPYSYGAVGIALRIIPVGLAAFLVQAWGSFRPAHFENVRLLLWPSLLAASVGSLLMMFGEGPGRYWSCVMPGMFIGSAGDAVAFLACNIGIMQSGPPQFAGVAGAIFNSSLQIGLSIALAALTVIQATVAARSPVDSFAPTRAQHAFMVALMGVEALLVLVFYRRQEVDDREKEVILGEC